ncbi:hypothetical protein AN958_04885 [Leucoagaricus sp. SymC.cos]|nr:hypothetical protein AN958_04885 [Leucoagaricus sp. SymC.cos]
MRDARVILADPNTDVFQHLVKTHQNEIDRHIESYLWVKKCIEEGALTFTPFVYKNPGGRRPGDERTPFTIEDEDHLCQWIAEKIPYKETGGRTGNRLYQQLCEQTGLGYSWVTRHTWQSWRERYKKHAYRLDEKIASIVAEKRPAQGEQGQYGYVRQPEEKPKRTRKKRGKTEDVILDDDDDTANQAEEELAQLSKLSVPISSVSSVHLPVIPPQVSPSLAIPQETEAPVNNGPAEEEMDDNEESQWAVRVGNEPPPAWAKRRADENPHQSSPNKRQKASGDTVAEIPLPVPGPPQGQQSVHSPTQALNTSTLVALANMHVIDQSLREIAKDYRFTLEEVQEFYDECGDMGLTRQRFKYFREILTGLKVPDDVLFHVHFAIIVNMHIPCNIE